MLRCWPSLALLLLATALSASSQSFENSAIVRTIELGGALVHVTTTYAAKALEADASVYTLSVPTTEIYTTSWLEVKIKGQQKPLTVVYAGDDGRTLSLDVQLPKPMEINSTVNLVFETVHTHATRPWPEQAAQQDDQSLKYDTELFVPSPYKTNVQRTKVKSSSPRIISYTTPVNVEDLTLENPVTKSGATVTYGPYNNVPVSNSDDFIKKYQQTVTLHYNYDYPVLEVNNFKRAAEISHWGANLNIQDELILHNAGPKLKGHFSRLEHQTQAFYKRAAPHVLPSLTLHLPAGIRNTYFYDQIGNVSTSRLRTAPSAPRTGQKTNQYSVMELRPRYPIMGGWNYSFTLGWDSPLEDSTVYNKETGKYIVQVPVMTEIPGAAVNDAELKVILPEGATDVEYHSPFPAAFQELSTHVTYLDTIGRPVITLHYKRLTDKHVQSIYVSYKVPLSAHLRKPMAVATVLMSLFTFAVVARRIDLTIHKKKV